MSAVADTLEEIESVMIPYVGIPSKKLGVADDVDEPVAEGVIVAVMVPDSELDAVPEGDGVVDGVAPELRLEEGVILGDGVSVGDVDNVPVPDAVNDEVEVREGIPDDEGEAVADPVVVIVAVKLAVIVDVAVIVLVIVDDAVPSDVPVIVEVSVSVMVPVIEAVACGWGEYGMPGWSSRNMVQRDALIKRSTFERIDSTVPRRTHRNRDAARCRRRRCSGSRHR